MRKQRGITLLEILVTLIASAILIVGVALSYEVAISWQRRAPEKREAMEKIYRFQDRLISLIENAYISSDENDAETYFMTGTGDEISDDASSLVFTSTGDNPSEAYLNADSEAEFETLNETYGPQAGITEISLSLTPVGAAPVSNGLFIREQRPADGDETQGGKESLLNPDVETIFFEFWDGTEWATSWTTDEIRRLPAAVRVTYRIADEDADRILVIRLKNSDVTTLNPATPTQGGTQN